MMRDAVWLNLRRLGLPGLLGLSLMLVAAWMHWNWVPAQQLQLDVLASNVRQVRSELQQDALSSVQSAATKRPWDLSGLSPEAAWQTVWDTLPGDAQRVAMLNSVTTSARKLGVNMASIQYRGAIEPWSLQPGQALWRQRMTMPVEGRYGDVRAWLGTLLNQPNLSLDTFEINRGDTSTDLVKGRVGLSLWWRTTPGRTP